MSDKIISFFWGNSKMSWLRYLTLYSFAKYNPGWKIVLYTCDQKIHNKTWKSPEVQDFFEYKGKDYTSKISDLGIEMKNYDVKTKDGRDISPSQKSNFFKWNLLATTGGFYADMDILFLRSVEDLYQVTKSYDTGLTYTKYYSIGFMFSNGQNKFFKDVYNECYNNFHVENYQGAGVLRLNRWPHINNIQKEYGKVYNIPFRFLYKYSSEIISNIYEINSSYNMDEDSIGLHWYAGHVFSQKANNELNENTYKKENNLLSRVINHILS
jgi:hypothetical protein